MSDSENIIFRMAKNNMLSLLIIEGGLSAADVQLLRHVSAALNTEVIQLARSQPLLFTGYNYFLKNFERLPSFTIMHFKYGYSTPADIIKSGRFVLYESDKSPLRMKLFNDAIREKATYCNLKCGISDKTHIILKDVIDTIDKYLKDVGNQTKIIIAAESKYEIFGYEKFYEECVITLLQYGYEELAAENFKKIGFSCYPPLFYAIRNGHFKFISIVINSENYNNTAFYYCSQGDIYPTTFIDNAAAYDFYCKIILKKQSEATIARKIFQFSKNIINKLFIPVELFYGGGAYYSITENKYLEFVQNIINNGPDCILFYIYTSSRMMIKMLPPIDKISNIELDENIRDFISVVFSELFSQEKIGFLNGKIGKGDAPYNDHIKILFLAAYYNRRTFIQEVLDKDDNTYNNQIERKIGCINLKNSKLQIKIDLSTFQQKIYIIVIAALNQGNVSLLEMLLNIEETRGTIKEFFDIFFILAWSNIDSSILISDTFDKREFLPKPRLLSFNIMQLLNNKLSYELPIDICKSDNNEFISKWNLIFFHGLKCKCGGLYHRNTVWNMSPPR